MPRSLNALLLAVALLVAGCAGTQPAAAPPSGDTAMEDEGASDDGTSIETVDYDVENLTYPDLPDIPVPDVEEMTLPNGLKVFLIEDHELPTVSASARIGVGEVWAPADRAGLADMTGTVMRTGGTESMSSDEVNLLLENLGATVETGIGETSGSAFMNTLSENVDEVLPVFVDVLARPAFAEEKVAQAKSQARSAISRRNDNPGQIVQRVFQDLIYGADSPYARDAEYYTVDAIERQDLVDFHAQYFHPNNTILSVWGDFDTAQMKQKLRSAFGGWEQEAGFEPPTPPQPESENEYAVHLVQKDDVNQSTVRMGYLGELTQDDPDYFPVIVMNEVLSGGFTSRLFSQVRTEQGLAYSVGGRYVAGYRTPGPFLAQVQTKSGSTVKAARSVLNEIEKLRQAPPTEDEVQLAKDSYLNAFVFNFDTRQEVLSRLMTYEAYGYPRDFLQQTRQGVAGVTPDDVFRVSQKYLHPGQVDILVLGRSQDFDEPLEALAQGGTVDEIDISIPTSAPGAETDEPAASEEDMAAGREALMAVREAMGGSAFDQVENMRQSTTSVVQSPQGEQTVESTLAVALPDRVHAEVTLPNGLTLTAIDDGEQMMLQTPQGTQPAPPPFRQQINGQLRRDLVYLMTQADALEVASQGTETVDGTAYTALRITPPGGEPLTLMVDPETMLPARMTYQGVSPQTGPFEGTNVYADYREVDGLMVPFQITSRQNGEAAGTTTVTAFETNVDFEDGYFSTGP